MNDLMPVAPGTWGSAVGVGLFVAWRHLDAGWQTWARGRGVSAAGAETLESCLALLLLMALFLAGIWAASRVEKITGKKDPSVVIVDEIIGQLITYLFLPRTAGWGLLLLCVAVLPANLQMLLNAIAAGKPGWLVSLLLLRLPLQALLMRWIWLASGPL